MVGLLANDDERPRVGRQAATRLRRLVYVGLDGEANPRELALLPSGWSDSVPPTGAALPAGQLFGHRAPGNRNSILFRGTNEGDVHGYELSMPNGGAWGLQEF